MGVTAQDIQICVWQVLKFSAKTFYYCARKHPIASSILIFLFLLYMFLPSVFTFLIYFSPLFVFTYAVHRVFLVIDRQKAESSKENEKKNDDAAWSTNNDAAIDCKKGSSSSAYTTAIRRNASQKSNEDYKSSSDVENKDTVCSTSFNNHLVDKSALAEDNPKEIREVKVDSVVDRVRHPWPETHDVSKEGFQKFANSKSETSERESTDDTEDDEEEEQEEDRNKAVRWTEDDQKNLMDLGLSEIERNKRLESLIARRRSRKFMSLQGRRTMGSSNFTSQISSLQIPRSNPFLEDNSGSQTSPIPGSAPSILLPTNNPFDLPYDPFEEKPNLTGGSFHQEFMVPNQKEMMFCRHESLSMGAFLPPDAKTDYKHEMHHDFFTKQRVFESPPSRPGTEPNSSEQIHQQVPQPEAALLKNDSASNEGQEDGATSEQALSSVDNRQEGDEKEVQTKEIVVDNVLSSSSNSSSSSETTEPISRPNREAILNSLRLSSRRNMFADREGNCQTNNELYDSAPSEFNKRKAENFFNVNMDLRHTPSHSIASDLQVEVSEVGSPSLTNISSQDEVSSTNDGDIEKEINLGREEMWAASTHLSGVDENESRSREVHEVSEQDIIGIGFSNVDRKSDPDASPALPEKVISQDTNDSHSFQAPSYETSSTPIPEKARISTAEVAATRSHEGDSVKPEESCGPMKLEHKPKTIDRVNDPEVHVKNETEDFISAANMSSKSQTSIQEESAGNLSIHQKGTGLKSSESGGQVQKQFECEYPMDSSKPHEIKDHLTSLDDLEKGVQNLAQEEDMLTENVGKKSHDKGEHGLEEVQNGASESEKNISNYQTASSNLDHKESETLNPDMVQNNHLDEYGTAEGGASQSIGDQQRSAAVVPDLVVEQVPDASTLSSPKSVLQPAFSIDQSSSPSLGEEMYSEVRRSEIANGETNSLHQQQHDNLTPEDAMRLNDIPGNVPSHAKDSKMLEDSGSPSMTSSKELNHVSSVNESETEETNSKDKLDSTSDGLQISSNLEGSVQILRPARDTDPKETEAISKTLSGNQSPAPESIPADQNGIAMPSLTRQEEQSNPLPEWPMEQSSLNSTVYDSGSEIGHKRSKSIAGGSDCASESITRKSSIHHSFSRSSEDFIQDLFSSLVGRSASASASVTRQSSIQEFSRRSEDFLQDLFKSLVSEAGGSVSNRTSRQGSMLESSGSTEDMIQDLFKSLQDNPRE